MSEHPIWLRHDERNAVKILVLGRGSKGESDHLRRLIETSPLSGKNFRYQNFQAKAIAVNLERLKEF